MWIVEHRKWIIRIFTVLTVLSIASLPFLNFLFDFERFFPDGDEDLDFYQEFVKEFESDDNYLLVALPNEPSVLDSEFFLRVRSFSEEVAQVRGVENAMSLPTLQRPVLGLFGFSFEPIFDFSKGNVVEVFDSITQEQSIFKNLIATNRKSTVVALKVTDHLDIKSSLDLIDDLEKALSNHQFEKYHLLGRAYFQKELARLQVIEVAYSSVFSFLVVSLILFLLYRNVYLIFITLISITLGLILFLGLLSLLQRPLDAISALYPVLMLIVGSSDVIHILSKYLDELRKGNPIPSALDTTIRQIGLATFFTSATTAIGFLSLITSRIGPVRDFGVNAALGVIVAYITIIFFTTALLTYFSPDKLKTHQRTFAIWDNVALWFYRISKKHVAIIIFSSVLLVLSVYGISKISTDYRIQSSLPRGEKVTEDFLFFEENYTGYRPVEYVLTNKSGKPILDEDSGYKLIKSISDQLQTYEPIENVASVSTIVGMISSFLPFQAESNEISYHSYRDVFDSAVKASPTVLLNKKKDKTRISAQIKDIGAYKIKEFTDSMDEWVADNMDASKYELRYTGTGLIIDKNAVYVRESLLKGLGFALIIIGLLMGVLFRSFKMVILSLVPNAIPLFIAGALLGYSGIPLEPLTSITFVVIFGIAVDDTIHFLSKYRLCLHSGMGKEEAIKISFQESGKAILFTTVVLFFGFMVMLFSANPGSVIVGALISFTLFTAVFADLIVLPLLLRVFS